MIELALQTVVQWLPIGIVVIAIVVLLTYLVIKAHQRKVETGNEGLIGEYGVVKNGKVFVHGELWKAESEEKLDEGDKVVVTGVERMMLHVRKK